MHLEIRSDSRINSPGLRSCQSLMEAHDALVHLLYRSYLGSARLDHNSKNQQLPKSSSRVWLERPRKGSKASGTVATPPIEH